MKLRRQSPFMEVPMGEHVMTSLEALNAQKRAEAIAKLGPRWVFAHTRNLSRVCCPTLTEELGRGFTIPEGTQEFKVEGCYASDGWLTTQRAAAGLTAP